MANRLDKTAADYIAIAVGPALIMAMVGSLVYFLLDVFYQGEYEERLQWIMACFVFAAVLIGRIAITEGKARAVMFAFALALPMGLAIAMLVEHHGPLASIGLYLDWALLGVIWWCAHKLTWDCTFIDEQQPDTGEGLLQTIGMDDGAQGTGTPTEVAERIAAQRSHPQDRRLEGTTDDGDDHPPKPAWRRWFTGDARPHAPGKWVVYFSLAALPIFGIGQLFVPAANEERRQHVFRLLATYVASGLGLLLTTSFLGMRRYLRQRQVEMPSRVAGKWIALGAGLALGLLVLAVLLPRPNAEFAVSSLTGTIGSPQRQASRYAPPGGEGASDPAQQSRSTTTKGKGPRKKGGAATKTGSGASSDAKTGDGGGPSKTSGGDAGAKTSPGGEGNKSPSSKSPDGQPPGGEASKTSSSDTGSSGTKKSDSLKSDPATSGPTKSGASKSGATSSKTGEQPKQNDSADGSDQGDQGDEKKTKTRTRRPASPARPAPLSTFTRSIRSVPQ